MENNTLFFRLEAGQSAAKHMVNLLPKSVLEDPSSTFCDRAMGGGQLLRALTDRLGDEAQPRLYGYEAHPVFTTFAKRNNRLVNANLSLDFNDSSMAFSVNIGNPPYQAPKTNEKKGKGGNNSLYHKFIEKALETTEQGGFIAMITPPAALTKSTILGQPSRPLKKLLEKGALRTLDLTVGDHFNVGTAICGWVLEVGGEQGQVKVITANGESMVDLEDIFYLPPVFETVELQLYKKIVSNLDGEELVVTRGRGGECTMARFGYPKVQRGGTKELGFDDKFYDFMSSKLGLWLLDYMRRHDQMIYHNALTGIKIPREGFELTEEEQSFIDTNYWTNFGVTHDKV